MLFANMSENDLFEEGLGNVTWWGFSPVNEVVKHSFKGEGNEIGIFQCIFALNRSCNRVKMSKCKFFFNCTYTRLLVKMP